jgi:prolyl-tRNA synthetase
MRYSQMLIPTLRQDPADAQVISHKLMVRAGYIRKVAAGIYNYLPLGLRVLRKVEAIVREEMNRAGAQELLMPAIQPAELWQTSGRWQQYGAELLRLKDRKGADFCVGPTHEEVITSLVRDEVKSYRQVPLCLYQIQTKFRDEIRPRFGLMRGREFIMKDAYSFDIDEPSAQVSYDKMFAAYERIFKRCGLEFRPVEADTGAIGGNRSHEFQVLADTGEDAIAVCADCDYAANVELAEIQAQAATDQRDSGIVEKVLTPDTKTIEEVAAFLGLPSRQVIKAVLMMVDDAPVMALCRGDHEVNEVKLKRALKAQEARLLEDAEIQTLLASLPGFAGPVGLTKAVTVIADHGLNGMSEMVCGANEKDHHWVQVQVGRDFQPAFADLRSASEGDPCGRCGSAFDIRRGIEVGHVFSLGQKYSDAMDAQVLDESGKARPLLMGCYGIGIGRTAAAAIEQNHDDLGIKWPMAIAPFQVILLSLGKDDELVQASKEIYDGLTAAGIEVLWDDRPERPGVKFKDADLLGIPMRLTLGKRGLESGLVELKDRHNLDAEAQSIALSDIVSVLELKVKERLNL